MGQSTLLLQGLTNEEVTASREKNGVNSLEYQDKNSFLASLIEMVKEPMFLLLILATSIYFITGDYGDGIFMAVAIILVSTISLYQESRSRNAIELLKKLSQPWVEIYKAFKRRSQK